MSQLQDKLDEINRQKQLKILPENIRENIEIFGITGQMTTENMWQPIRVQNEGNYYLLSFVNPNGNYNVQTIRGYDNYRIVKFYNDTKWYLYDVLMDKPKYITDQVPTDVKELLGYTETDVYFLASSGVYKYNLQSKEISSKLAGLPDMASSYCDGSDGNYTTMHFCQCYYNGYTYRYNIATNTWTKTNYDMSSVCFGVYVNEQYEIYINSYYRTANSYATRILNKSTGVLKTYSNPKIQGFTKDMTRIMMDGKLYHFDVNTGIGALIGNTPFTKKTTGSNWGYYIVRPISEKYYYCDRELFEYNSSTDTFTKIADVASYGTIGDHYTTNIVGYTFLGQNYFFAQGKSIISDDKILSGHTARDQYLNAIQGTMPDNGQLSYTPTKKSQTIPAGYTSGGVISAVTSAIDSNIKPENIKYGVEILGVAGVIEQDAAESVMTQEEYDTCLALANSILGM